MAAKRPVFNRGPRPALRGYLHLFAFWYFLGTGTGLSVVALTGRGDTDLSVATVVYSLCLAGMLAVSATYHRFPLRSESSVQGWRRADHSMIAVFIAGTYGPVFIGADAPGDKAPIFIVCWSLALVAVAMNIFWIDHPRWLSVAVYLGLGWVAVFGMDMLTAGLSTTELVLILVGGFIYSAGALCYALKWPNISEKWFGFHEMFHAGTIVAAGLHHIAIWMIVLGAS
ncbi:PAQR family membrane homeostasis protein TrhA [Corynebacterium neomassiliense]|uniref:PAQR family membrane homeostasis protein TrhA n=1 Tax=Corynebacterium neomassiliense TaxID=2079482 RepID=UPI00192A1EC3|nr:hemolysin III family protein [Corynebacterium neomassiliense]